LITLGSETSGGIRHVYASQLSAKHTDNGLRIKSATTRGGTIEDIYFVDSKLDSVLNAYQFNLNWYPAYSYSQLPAGYTKETAPAHWISMLNKVEPASKGIPQAKNIVVQNVSITHAVKAFEINGLPNSILENFKFVNSLITAQTLGTMEHTAGWKFINTTIDISAKVIEKKKVESIADEERLKQ
jgi:polygalacturonase